MGLATKIVDICIRLLDWMTFWLKTNPKRILFVSMRSNSLDTEFQALADELNDFQIDYVGQVVKPTLWGKLAYFFNCLCQFVKMKQAAWIILQDNNYLVTKHKPKQARVLQLWHASGAIKQFGNQVKRSYPIHGYDVVACCGSIWQPIYAQAFGVQEQQVRVVGLPRLDDFLRVEPAKLDTDKKICLYAPTFRGNFLEGMYYPELDFEKLAKALPDYQIVVRYHPLCQGKKTESVIESQESLYALMKACDVLVSDYSSLMLEYTTLHKPLLCYVPDLERYQQEVGLNIDLPGQIIQTEDEWIDALTHLDQITKSPYNLITTMDGECTHRLANIIRES